MDDVRQVPLAEFMKWSRIGTLFVLTPPTLILGAMAYWDVPIRWMIVATFFATAHAAHGAVREAIRRLDPLPSGRS